MTLRVFATIFLIFSALFLPFFMTVFFAAGFSFVFRRYLEILPIFLLIDIVYGISEHRYHMVLGISVLASIIIFAGAELIKSRLVFYEHDKA